MKIHIPYLTWLTQFQLPAVKAWNRWFADHFQIADEQQITKTLDVSESDPLTYKQYDTQNLKTDKKVYRFRCYFLTLQVNQRGLHIERVLFERNRVALSHIVDRLNALEDDSFSFMLSDVDQLHPKEGGHDLYLMIESTKPLPSKWPDITEVFSKNWVTLVEDKRYQEWMIQLNEFQMCLNQGHIFIDNAEVNGLWITPDISRETENDTENLYRQGVEFALSNQLNELNQWFETLLLHTQQLKGQYPTLQIDDRAHSWRPTTWRQSIKNLWLRLRHVF